MDILQQLYQLAAVLVVVLYIPQITKAKNDDTGAKSSSIITWAGWTVTAFICLLYAHYKLNDDLAEMMAWFNFAGCLLTTYFVIRARIKDNRKSGTSRIQEVPAN